MPALRHGLDRADGATVAAATAVLAGLWSIESNYPRLAALAADTGRPLSHYRPSPAYVEVARTAAVLCTVSLFMDFGPRVVRHLVTLRRLPPAPPDTLLRAIAVVLSAVPEMLPPDYDVLRKLCDSERPLVAGIAECVATLRLGARARHRPRARLRPADDRRTGGRSTTRPCEVMAHARLGELCLKTGPGRGRVRVPQGGAARRCRRLGDEHDYIGIRWGLALACLQRGDPDEAEYWLRQAEGDGTAQQDAFYSPDLGVRAEIALARGLTEAGLGLWRSAVERLSEAGAHARRRPLARPVGAADPVGGGDGARPRRSSRSSSRAWPTRLRALLSGPSRAAHGAPGARDGAARARHGGARVRRRPRCARAVRMIALAERLRVLREFQPTMSAARARRAAEDADGAAYADAVSEYAALGRDELREAARAAGYFGSRLNSDVDQR